MADVKFKLDEGVLGDIGKGAGKELAKIALSPLTGGYEGSSKIIDNISNVLKKRGYYAAEQELEKYTKGTIHNWFMGLIKKVKIVGKVGFEKESFNTEELNLIEDNIDKFINDKIKEYREKVKRALSYDSAPPKPDYKKDVVIRQFSETLGKEIKTKYKADEDKYYRINKWYKDGMKLVGSTLPRMIYKEINPLAEKWGELETKAKGLKNG